jgi:hypothetical protein
VPPLDLGFSARSASSRSLVGRVQIEPQGKRDLRDRNLSEAAKEWLEGQGWTLDELRELEEQPDLLFSWVFFLKVQGKDKPDVLSLFPPDTIRQFKEDLTASIREIEVIESAYESTNLEGPFFSAIDPQQLSEAQAAFLRAQGWSEEELQALLSNFVTDFVQELVTQALDRNNPLVVYNIHKDHQEEVFGVCTVRKDELQDSLSFIETSWEEPSF